MQKIAIVSNVNLDMIVQMQKKKHEVFDTEGYGEWFRYAFQRDAALCEFEPQYIFVLIDGGALLENCLSNEEAWHEIDLALSKVKRLAENYSDSNIFISTLYMYHHSITSGNGGVKENRWCAYWNDQLPEICRLISNLNIFDLNSLAESVGTKAFYSDKMWYMGSIPYSVKGMGEISKEIDAVILRNDVTPKKVLVLDLDNTLWGGVLGEDGIEGVTLGRSLLGAAYRDAQKHIKELKEMGVLIAIVSKNNEDEVMAMLEQNSQMVLRKDDFAAVIANWNLKSENIKKLATQLNLGLDSFVFLDDNPVEQEEVHLELPMVSVADFPKDIANLPETIHNIYLKYFYRSRVTDEDKVKTDQYRAEANRHKDMEEASTLDEFIKSLNIKILVNEAADEQSERIIQLSNKTNQFNTCTVRFDRQSYFSFRECDGNHIFVASVSDRYGDSGLVFVALITVEESIAYIKNVLMSCRVMGRQIENAIIEAIENQLFDSGVRTVVSEFVPTSKNKPVEMLWDKLGYTLQTECNGTKTYAKDLTEIQSTALLKVEWK